MSCENYTTATLVYTKADCHCHTLGTVYAHIQHHYYVQPLLYVLSLYHYSVTTLESLTSLPTTAIPAGYKLQLTIGSGSSSG